MTTPLTPESTAYAYCNSTSDVDNVFGRSNVDKWALLSTLDPASAGGMAEIVARRLLGVQYATSYIDDRLRDGPYALPLTKTDGTVPYTILQLAATLAGIWLYENRGTVDYNAETGIAEHRYSYKAKWCEKTLDQISSRKIRLAVGSSGSGKGTNGPFVTKDPMRRTYGVEEIGGQPGWPGVTGGPTLP